MKKFRVLIACFFVAAALGAMPVLGEDSECVQCQRAALQKMVQCDIEAGKDEDQLRGANKKAACSEQHQKDHDACRIKPGCP